jgi:hypothetical protein
MPYTGVRSGVFAVLNGKEYSSRPVQDGSVMLRSAEHNNPHPERFAWDERVGAWQAVVPIADLDRLYQTNVYARFQGHWVSVAAHSDAGEVTAYYADTKPRWAQDNGFKEIDRSVWIRQRIPMWELREVCERQEDLLFRRWRQDRFPAPASRRGRAVGNRRRRLRVPAANSAKPFERPRSGVFAVVGGREYHVASDPRSGVVELLNDASATPDQAIFELGQDDLWRARVRIEECERLARVRTLTVYRGHECRPVAIAPDGSVRLQYLGTDESGVMSDGFVRSGQGGWQRTADVHDLTRFWEHHVDLLFAGLYGAPPT